MRIDVGSPLRGQELAEFLQLGITARLSCLDGRGWPYCVPVWHQWNGEHFWVIGAKSAAWVGFTQMSPRIALCIDEPETLRRVLCQGTARTVEGPRASGKFVDIARQMAARYLGDSAVEAYETATFGLERWLIAVDVDRLITSRGPGRADGEATSDPRQR